jgi:hypothetical protein
LPKAKPASEYGARICVRIAEQERGPTLFQQPLCLFDQRGEDALPAVARIGRAEAEGCIW